jgi:hypothetical protein
VGAAAGAAVGAGAGAVGGDAGTGAIAGGALGGAAGAVGGAVMGAQAASEEADSQLRTTALQDRYVEPGYSVTGYVFYPPGEYIAVEAMLIDEEGNPQSIRGNLIR